MAQLSWACLFFFDAINQNSISRSPNFFDLDKCDSSKDFKISSAGNEKSAYFVTKSAYIALNITLENAGLGFIQFCQITIEQNSLSMNCKNALFGNFGENLFVDILQAWVDPRISLR